MSRSAAEEWFTDRGLPYFVDSVHDQVLRRLGWPIRVMAILSVLFGVVFGLVIGYWFKDVALGVTSAVTLTGLLLFLIGLSFLDASSIARWGVRSSLQSLNRLVPLATRALPMLLIFMTFLFINAEVWQVASSLSRGVLWGVVLFFTGAAAFFLVSRLNSAMEDFRRGLDGERLIKATQGTPWHADTIHLVDHGFGQSGPVELTRLQRLNLLLVLVFSQAVQVLLLSLAVFTFFMLFGSVAISDIVIKQWTQSPATYFGYFRVFSWELTQVSIFLAGFAALYFTVTAVTDENYRAEFFEDITDQLAQAVCVHALYRQNQDDL